MTDPRNMDFAHLGFRYWALETSPLPDGDVFLVDYRKYFSGVFAGVSKLLSEVRNLYLVLSSAEDVKLEEQRYRLPSWVPDWTHPTLPRLWITLSTFLERAEKFILENWKPVPRPGEGSTNPSYGRKDYFKRVSCKDMTYKHIVRRQYPWVGEHYLNEKEQLGNYESWCISSSNKFMAYTGSYTCLCQCSNRWCQ